IFCCCLTVVLLNSRLLISAGISLSMNHINNQQLSKDYLTELSNTGVISVQSATYGRTSSQICSFGRPQSQISNTWCSINDNGTRGIPNYCFKCDGLRTCGLNTQGLSTPDPCFGTYKYYTTNYICIPAETSVTCHGGYGYLKCKNGKIQINAANYGRTDKITCSHGRPSEQLQNTNCYSPNALSFVSKSCNGLENCEVYATHMIFTDPCFGTYKYLAISYFCLPHGIREYLSSCLILNSFCYFQEVCLEYFDLRDF
uniref:L-rhamnose-binding lectin CSL3-like n=1 Tax=Sinocyclocheilus grahami TaxID=75366 RepID=A0A672MY55_SINGR